MFSLRTSTESSSFAIPSAPGPSILLAINSFYTFSEMGEGVSDVKHSFPTLATLTTATPAKPTAVVFTAQSFTKFNKDMLRWNTRDIHTRYSNEIYTRKSRNFGTERSLTNYALELLFNLELDAIKVESGSRNALKP